LAFQKNGKIEMLIVVVSVGMYLLDIAG